MDHVHLRSSMKTELDKEVEKEVAKMVQASTKDGYNWKQNYRVIMVYIYFTGSCSTHNSRLLDSDFIYIYILFFDTWCCCCAGNGDDHDVMLVVVAHWWCYSGESRLARTATIKFVLANDL